MPWPAATPPTAVSRAAGEPWRDRMLHLPAFLRGDEALPHFMREFDADLHADDARRTLQRMRRPHAGFERGGVAFSRQATPLERVFRDARAGWVMAPTVDHLDDFIGKALTGLPPGEPAVALLNVHGPPRCIKVVKGC